MNLVEVTHGLRACENVSSQIFNLPVKTDKPNGRAGNVSLGIYRCYPFPLSLIYDNTRATQTGSHLSEALYETGKIVQPLECLPHKHEDLTSIAQNPYKKPSIMAHPYNPRAVKAESGRPGAHWPASMAFLFLPGQVSTLPHETKGTAPEK